MENWKPVVGYELSYEVSDLGNVRGIERKVYHGNCTMRMQKAKIIKQHPDGSGYMCVGLHNGGNTQKAKVHRLVMQAFVGNDQCLPEVNHLDENIRNNKLSNLAWCTRKENENYGTKRERCKAHTDYKAIAACNMKRVAQCTMDGTQIKIWESLAEIHKATGYSTGNISMCCTGKHKNGLYGYVWCYV